MPGDQYLRKLACWLGGHAADPSAPILKTCQRVSFVQTEHLEIQPRRSVRNCVLLIGQALVWMGLDCHKSPRIIASIQRLNRIGCKADFFGTKNPEQHGSA